MADNNTTGSTAVDIVKADLEGAGLEIGNFYKWRKPSSEEGDFVILNDLDFRNECGVSRGYVQILVHCKDLRNGNISRKLASNSQKVYERYLQETLLQGLLNVQSETIYAPEKVSDGTTYICIRLAVYYTNY